MRQNEINEVDPRKLYGGAKLHWLRENRHLVLEYLAKHGLGTTMVRFGISHPDTLERLIKWESEEERPANSYEVRMARLTADAAIETAKEAHVELRKLKQAQLNFVEDVADQLRDKFLVPLLRLAFRLDTQPFKTESPLLLDGILNVPQLKAPKRKRSPIKKRMRDIYLTAHPFADH